MPHYSNNAGISSTIFLRRITIFTFPPALIMFIIHGVISNEVFPALGLLPLAASVVFGSFLIFRERIAALGSPIQAFSPSNILFADVALAIWYLGFLIPTWIALPRQWREEAILGTYCSVFMMVNFAIHLYFAAGEALHIVTTRPSPFKSLASEYTPLTEEYRDDVGDIEEGN